MAELMAESLVLGELAHECLMKPVEDSSRSANRNLAASKRGPSIRHEYPVDGQAMLASATGVQNSCTTHKVDMSQAAEDATRLFIQVTWGCQADKQDQLLQFAHKERGLGAGAQLLCANGPPPPPAPRLQRRCPVNTSPPPPAGRSASAHWGVGQN
jgi:hypothetical protein